MYSLCYVSLDFNLKYVQENGFIHSLVFHNPANLGMRFVCVYVCSHSSALIYEALSIL